LPVLYTNEERTWGDVIRALYEARLEDLGPGDLVKGECACGHTELLTPSMLATAGVKPYESILDLQLKLRCRECDVRGRVVVSIRWKGTDV
jgi:hypothetical protein